MALLPPASSAKAPCFGGGRVQVVVVGPPGVGKTALAQRILRQDAALASQPLPAAVGQVGSSSSSTVRRPTVVPTVGVDFATRSVGIGGGKTGSPPVRLHLWDTSGQERFASLVEGYLRELQDHDALVAVYDVRSLESLEEAIAIVRKAQGLAAGSPRVAFVGAKADLGTREVTLDDVRIRAEELGAALFVEVSCVCDSATVDSDRLREALPESVLSTRSKVEDGLVRPLLRACLETAPPDGFMQPSLLPPNLQGGCAQATGCAQEVATNGSARGFCTGGRCSRPLLRCLGIV